MATHVEVRTAAAAVAAVAVGVGQNARWDLDRHGYPTGLESEAHQAVAIPLQDQLPEETSVAAQCRKLAHPFDPGRRDWALDTCIRDRDLLQGKHFALKPILRKAGGEHLEAGCRGDHARKPYGRQRSHGLSWQCRMSTVESERNVGSKIHLCRSESRRAVAATVAAVLMALKDQGPSPVSHGGEKAAVIVVMAALPGRCRMVVETDS